MASRLNGIAMNERTLKTLDSIMEFGIYLYVFALFNHGTTALSSLGLYVPLLAWITKHALTKGKYLSYLRHPLAIATLVFGGVVLISTLYAPDFARSLGSYKKSIGAVVMLMLVTGETFIAKDKQKRLLYVLVGSGIYVTGLELYQYITDALSSGSFAMPYPRFRSYAAPLLFFTPFTLALAFIRSGKGAVAWWIVFMGQAVLLVGTGARGAWLGFAAAMFLWLIVKFDKRFLALAVIATSISIVALTVVIPNNVVTTRLHEGLSTSHRESGTWGPSYEMLWDKPLLGYGYGKWVYHDEFNRRAPFSQWPIKKSMGPHSSYLAIAFAAGLLGLASMIALWAKMFEQLLKVSTTERDRFTAYFATGVLASFVAEYLIQGFVESVRWQPLGILLGIAVALLVSRDLVPRPRATEQAPGTSSSSMG